MGINDYGTPTDPLNAPSLSSWAEAVALVFDGSDVSVDTRLAAYVLADGSRALTGDLDMADNDVLNAGFVYAANISAITSRADNLDAGFNDVIAALKPITLPLAPVADMEVANKKYVDDNGGASQYGDHLLTLIDGDTGQFGYRGEVVTDRPTTPTYAQGARSVIDTTQDPTYNSPPPFALTGDAWVPNEDANIVPGEPAQRAATGVAFSTAKHVGGLTVASAGAPQAMKDEADYVCDGVADQVQINAALIQATRPGDGFGGEGQIAVYLVGPYFNISDSILRTPNTSLFGGGWGTMIEPPTSDADKGAIENLNVDASQGGLLADFTIGLLSAVKFRWDGIRLIGSSKGDAYEGWMGNDTYTSIRNIRVLDTTRKGIHVGGVDGGNGMRETQMYNCLTWNTVDWGVDFDGASDSKIRNCVASGNAGRSGGFRIAGGNTMVTACKSYYQGNASGGNASPGFLASSSRVSIRDCEAQDSGGYGFDVTGIDCTLVGNLADSNAAQSASHSGFRFTSIGMFADCHAVDRQQNTLRQDIGIIIQNTPQMFLTGRVKVDSGTNHIQGSAGSNSYAQVVRDGSTVWTG